MTPRELARDLAGTAAQVEHAHRPVQLLARQVREAADGDVAWIGR